MIIGAIKPAAPDGDFSEIVITTFEPPSLTVDEADALMVELCEAVKTARDAFRARHEALCAG